MRSSQFAELCCAAANLASDSEAEAGWRALNLVFDAASSLSVERALTKLADVHRPGSQKGAMTATLDQARLLRTFMKHSAKPAALADMEHLVHWLEANSSSTPEALVHASSHFRQRAKASSKRIVDAGLVKKYVAALEEALGDESFAALHATVNKDKAVDAATAKEIARAFTGRPGRGRKDAIDRIWERHAGLIDGRKRIEAIDGRTAA